MKLEVGRIYRTKDGSKVKINRKSFMRPDPFPYEGEMEGFKSTCSYAENGKYDDSHSSLDIIAEWEEEKKYMTAQGDKIEVGEVYFGRNNDKIFIALMKKEHEWPIHGIVAGETNARYFNAEGKCYNNPGIDLICNISKNPIKTDDGKIIEVGKSYKHYTDGSKVTVQEITEDKVFYTDGDHNLRRNMVGVLKSEWVEEKPWIEWTPIIVPQNVKEVRLRSGVIQTSSITNYRNWMNDDSMGDIVAYRLKD